MIFFFWWLCFGGVPKICSKKNRPPQPDDPFFMRFLVIFQENGQIEKYRAFSTYLTIAYEWVTDIKIPSVDVILWWFPKQWAIFDPLDTPISLLIYISRISFWPQRACNKGNLRPKSSNWVVKIWSILGLTSQRLDSWNF